jgi:hypothetical protein
MPIMSTALSRTPDVFSVNVEDEPPMTMQVGIVGSHGIVLAGDTLAWDYPNPDSIASRQELSTRMSQTVSKIKVSDDRKIAVSCAGYLREAYPLADGIIAALSPGFWQYPETRVCEIAKSYAASLPCWRDTQSFILLPDPMPALYLLDCLANARTNELLSPLCRRVPLYAFAGDVLNGAIYWAMRYCRALSPEMRTLGRLTRLATQIIADAGALDTGNIGGLEVMQCDSTGIHQLTERENETLLQEAQQRSNQIQQLIIGN